MIRGTPLAFRENAGIGTAQGRERVQRKPGKRKRVKCDCSGRVVFYQGEVKHDLLNCVSLNPTVGIGERVQGAALRVRWRTEEGDDVRASSVPKEKADVKTSGAKRKHFLWGIFGV